MKKEPARPVKVKYSKIKRRILSHVLLVRMLILLSTVLALIFITFFSLNVAKKYKIPYLLNIIYNFAAKPVAKLASTDGRTNILIMGKAGGAHDGPDLTDTLMLISVSLKSEDIKIISIPRDIWVPEIRAKINSAYYWGNQKADRGLPAGRQGINFAKAITSTVVGVPIQYGAVINFSGFKEIIDEIGGIDVNIENSFTDNLYPIEGKENDLCGGADPLYMCRYETITFDKGIQRMDGATALKFVRSRHAQGIEGTDIARAARQQKVIKALEDKLRDKNTYKNPKKDIAILKVVLKSVETDIDYPLASILGRVIFDSKDSIKSYTIPEELLINPPVSQKYDMQSVFIPKAGSGRWEEIQKWYTQILGN